MVKFSYQYESQIVPEWKHAFVDYRQLKLDLERIRLANNVNASSNSDTEDNTNTSTLFSAVQDFLTPSCSPLRRDSTVIHVHRKLVSSTAVGDEYEMVVRDCDATKEFFVCLDEQLNKVNRFYIAKEEEFWDRGGLLKKQIDILSELRSVLKERDTGHAWTLSRTLPVIGYLRWGNIISLSSKKCISKEIKATINRTDLYHARKMIRQALMELYKGLGYLNTYRNLNMLAFIKILKKFDKVTGREVLPIYLKVVESSYFNSSNKVMDLGDELEELFIKHFAGGDRRKAMYYLKPLQRKESHSKIFLIGLLTGCLIALLTGYATMAHVSGTYRPRADLIYMETVYPILSVFGLLFLHFFLYGCNILAWRNARINYGFIFELVPTKELKYRDVFLVCAISMVVVFGVLITHLSLLTKGYSYAQVQAIPGLLLLGFLLVLVCPLNVLYLSSRWHFLRVIRNIILSPMYKVVMLDFFMADQLCSQVPMLRNLEYITCYYATRSYKNQDYGYCTKTKYYRDLTYVVSFLPYYWRAMQCARKWFDDGQKSNVVNLGKYVSAMLAAGAKVAYEKQQSSGWLCLVVVVSSTATIYQLYWDYVKDWGLLQPDSRNPWLRNELMLRQKAIYYISMGLNFVLRMAWMQTVLHSEFGNVNYRVTGLFLAALEVIRRGIWNFFRLENEHLNNVGNFRAVKTVPLPFHEVDDRSFPSTILTQHRTSQAVATEVKMKMKIYEIKSNIALV